MSLSAALYMFVGDFSPFLTMCLRCFMLMLSGPVELLFLLFLIAARFIVRFPIGLDRPPSQHTLARVLEQRFFRPDALPDVNHMRGMQCQIVLNIIFRPELN